MRLPSRDLLVDVEVDAGAQNMHRCGTANAGKAETYARRERARELNKEKTKLLEIKIEKSSISRDTVITSAAKEISSLICCGYRVR